MALDNLRGIIEGMNPLEPSVSSPVTLFLSISSRKNPFVQKYCFPDLVDNVLELDVSVLKSQIKKSALISIAGMVVPFACGTLISLLLYHWFQNSGSFFVFLLFCGVSISITAFPVLARILTEYGMLNTTVGFATITAASVDDVTAWILLALVIALSSSSSGLSALWILIVGLVYVLFVFYIVQRLYIKYLNKQGFLNGRDPNPQIVFITFLMVFISAWFTDILGIHAIFGGYIIGVIVPHNGGFAIKIAEKIEDLISIFFLPIYFALSGLNTNLGLLNSGKAWLMLVLTVFASFFGKILGCLLAARYEKFSWRESLTIGVLMSCKGLVELIVLNIGLKAKVINESVFSILVLSALITTFTTCPVLKWIYPSKYFKYVGNEYIDENSDRNSEAETMLDSNISTSHFNESKFSTMLVVNRLQQLSSITTLVSLFSDYREGKRDTSFREKSEMKDKLELFFLRLIKMTSRESSLILTSKPENFEIHDPITNTLRAFSQILSVSSYIKMAVCGSSGFSNKITEFSDKSKSKLIIIPALSKVAKSTENNLESYLGISTDEYTVAYSKKSQIETIMKVYKHSKSNVGVFVNRGFVSTTFKHEDLNFPTAPCRSESQELISLENIRMSENDPSKKPESIPGVKNDIDLKKFFIKGLDLSLPIIFVPFFGGTDDICTLNTVINLFSNSRVNILVMYYMLSNSSPSDILEIKNEDFCEQTPFIRGTTKEISDLRQNRIIQIKNYLKRKLSRADKNTSEISDISQEEIKQESSENAHKYIKNTKEDIEYIQKMLGINFNQLPSSKSKFDDKLFNLPSVEGSKEIFMGLDYEQNLYTPSLKVNNFNVDDTFRTVPKNGGLKKSELDKLKRPNHHILNKVKKEESEIYLSKKTNSTENYTPNTARTDVLDYNTNPRIDTTESAIPGATSSKLGIKPEHTKLNRNNPVDIITIESPKNREYLNSTDVNNDMSITCKRYKNVIFKISKTNTPLHTSLSHSMFLRHCDLVCCGRNIGYFSDRAASKGQPHVEELNNKHNIYYPNHDIELAKSEFLGSFRVKLDERSALGAFGERLHRLRCRASYLIIQSFVSDVNLTPIPTNASNVTTN
ncbi:K(+)/H(+) antiporter 1 [Smittium culicis]|uniref:K(+)/H(+) antiporter 1 n=1 Tax=Smittium culicis TaxID=133412 RepID=A0A1R1Y170_9FUNG|nr:K(+)/H(+) antiporter 1 [Smittium culicis]